MFDDLVDWGKNKAEQAGNAINDAAEEVANKVDQVIPDNIRNLTPAEIWQINQVFGNSLSAGSLRITDGSGAIPNTAWCSPSLTEPGVYWLNVGPDNYGRNLGGERRGLLIHEATHAWQGFFGLLPVSYMVGSVYCQADAWLQTGNNSNAYSYSEDNQLQFYEYNVEQQASIVGGWGSPGNSNVTDWRFRYIRDNIRPGLPNGESSPITLQPKTASELRMLASKVTVNRTFRRR